MSALITVVSCGVSTCGFIVLTGWLLHSPGMVTLLPGAIAMQFNTALCFSLLGLATWLRLQRGSEWAIAAATPLIVIGTLTLFEYMTGAVLGIDTLFFTPSLTRFTLHPGEMAATTAACFALCGSALCAKLVDRDGPFVLAMVGVVPAGLGGAALLGYVLGIHYVLPFELGSQMAVHTAGCFVAWGLAAIAVAWTRETRRLDGVPAWMPYVLSSAIAMSLLGFGFALRSDVELALMAQLTLVAISVVATGVASRQHLLMREAALTERTRLVAEVASRTEKLSEANAALTVANLALAQADRHKDEFLSVLSHELRTPLNAVMGYASLLEDEVSGPLNELQQEDIGKILHSAERMQNLVENLLAMASLQAGRAHFKLEPAEYAPLVAEALAKLNEQVVAAGKTLVIEVPAQLELLVDRMRITQVLDNLVDNALKFGGDGKRIVVRAARRGTVLVTEVEDDGPGIDAADMPRLWGRFQQLDMSHTRAVEGSGLGLAIAKSIVEAHHGTIGVDSAPGKGATFWFELPILRESTVPASVSNDGQAR